jgi:hypothetical protein
LLEPSAGRACFETPPVLLEVSQHGRSALH